MEPGDGGTDRHGKEPGSDNRKDKRMTGFSTLRETWNTQWGPQPVLALCGTEERKAPITLAGADARIRRFAGRAQRTDVRFA